jgi:integrase
MSYKPAPKQSAGVFSVISVIDSLIASKTSGNRRKNYVKMLRYYLRRFALNRENRPISDFRTEDIASFLAQFDNASNRQTWFNRINTLFSFAYTRELIAENPCDKIERIVTDSPDPKILCPAQTQLLLKLVTEDTQKRHEPALPYFALTTFEGVRPDDEMFRLDWSDVNLKTGTARIRSKVRGRNRIIELEPVTVKLLQPYAKENGPVAPSRSTIRRIKRSARETLGFKTWPKDVLRHTAASYLVSKYEDFSKVAIKLGNSEKILRRHYYVPVTKVDTLGFWNEWPTVATLPEN